MYKIRNNENKLVCCVDKEKRIVQIKVKNCFTMVQFLENGEIKVINK